MKKDLVYEINKKNLEIIGECSKISDRYRTTVFEKVQINVTRLIDSIEEVVSENYPEIKKARLTIEFE